MENKLLKVKEFAKIIKKDTAYIYRLLDKSEYNKFKVKKNGVVYVNIDLKEVIEAELYQQQEINISETQPKEETPKEKDNLYIEYLKEEIIELKAELKEKEKIINELNNKIIDLVIKSQEIAESALETTKQSQVLQLAEATKGKKNFIKRLFLNKGEK